MRGYWKAISCFAAMVILWIVTQSADAASAYTMTIVPDGTVLRNNNGALVRRVYSLQSTSETYTTTTIIHGDAVVATYTSPPGTSDVPEAVNDAEMVVGWRVPVGGKPHAVLFSGGNFTDLHAAIAAAFDLDSTSSSSYAYDVNDAGDIVGSISTAADSFGFQYRNGQVIDLGASAGVPIKSAASINNQGQITVAMGANNQAAVYFQGVVQRLEYSDPNYPDAAIKPSTLLINDAGQMTGQLSIPREHLPSAEHAFFYEGSVVKDIGTNTNAITSVASINNAGVAVGTALINHAGSFGFIYRDGVRTDLTSITDTSLIQGRTLAHPLAINDDGVILVDAFGPTVLLTPTTASAIDPAIFNFEAGTQGWESSGQSIVTLTASTAQKYAGEKSLGIQFNDSGFASVRVLGPSVRPGDTISFHIYLPADSKVDWIQPYALGGAADNWSWNGNWASVNDLRLGAWNTLTLSIPVGAHPLHSIGLEIFASQAWAGTIFLDGVDYGSTPDTAQYNFETGTQGWYSDGDPIATVATSAAQPFSGRKSLAVDVMGVGLARISVANPSIRPGGTITFHVFIPTGPSIDTIQPFALEGAAGNWVWHGNWQPIGSLQMGAWNTITVNVPAGAQPLAALGIELSVSQANAGTAKTIYIDSVGF